MHMYTFSCHWYCILQLVHCKNWYIIPPSFSLPPLPSLLSFLSPLPPSFLFSPPFLPPFSLLSSSTQEEQDSHIILANPMPQFDSVFKPQLPHKTTEIQPFTFEERYQGKPTRETLVQQILQKEKVQCMDTSQNLHYIGCRILCLGN